MSCGSLAGRGAWGRMDTCTCKAESLLCLSDTIPTYLISYTRVQHKVLKKNRHMGIDIPHSHTSLSHLTNTHTSYSHTYTHLSHSHTPLTLTHTHKHTPLTHTLSPHTLSHTYTYLHKHTLTHLTLTHILSCTHISHSYLHTHPFLQRLLRWHQAPWRACPGPLRGLPR